MITIVLNGKPCQHTPPLSIQGLVDGLAVKTLDGVALCLNGQVLARKQWAKKILNQGDEVEIVTAVSGG